MIPRSAITGWRKNAPWSTDAQIEQDLIISRALVDTFGDPFLRDRLAFRGGTALNKLFFRPATRYSEDIDLVQTQPGPIGPIIDAIRRQLHWLGDNPARDIKERMTHIEYSFESEIAPIEKMKLKLEINTREHGSILAREERVFSLKTRWYSGEASIPTYSIDELMGTKLRALYQRTKGRDLYDFAVAFDQLRLNEEDIVRCFTGYLAMEELTVSRAEYEMNLADKIGRREFREDIIPLLTAGVDYSPDAAYEAIMTRIVSRLHGAAAKGLN